jgi:hypothetical protein
VDAPDSSWLADGPNSEWITPQTETNAGGYYFYQTTFMIPTGYDPTTAVISGVFTSDNESIAIFVNGNPVPFGVVYPGPGDSGLPFTGSFTVTAVTAGFINGANTLVFEIRNRGVGGVDSSYTATGLRVEFNSQISTVGPSRVQTGQPVYTQDSNLSDFTSCSGQSVEYGTFIGGTLENVYGPLVTLSPTQTYTPTTATMEAALNPRIFGTDPPTNPLIVQFGTPVSRIVVFDSIDHYGTNWDAFQYQIWGGTSCGANCINFVPLFDPTGVSGGPANFTLSPAGWIGTGPTLVNNTLTPGLGCVVPASGCGHTTGYEAYFDFTSSGAYQFYAFRPSTFTLNNGGENEAELSAVAEAVPCSFLEVCKSSSSVNPVAGNFTFTSPAFTSAPSNSISVPVGSCSGPIPVIPGTVTITETPVSGVSLSGAVASGYDPVTLQPEDRLLSCTPPSGSATVTAVAGGVASETVATFTNQATIGPVPTGQLKICKIAGTGVTVGTNFNFTATSTSSAVTQTYTVPAGPASGGGYCVVDNSTFPSGATVKVLEVLPISTFYTVSSTVSPSGATGGSAIVAPLGTGITEVTFTNSLTTIGPFLGDFNGGLSFSATPSSPPSPQIFTLTSTPVVPFTATATVSSGPPGWLTVTPLSGTTPAAITVSVTALPAGAYNGAIAIASTDPNNPFSSTIPVTFIAAANSGFSFAGSMAQLAFAGGWNTFFTLVNTGTAPVQATLNFFDNNGNPLPVPLEFPQSSTTVGQPVTTTTLTVNPGAGQVQTAGSATQTTQVGSTQLLANGSLSGFAVFQQTNGSRIQAAVAPLENRTPAGFTIWYDNTGGQATGIALANASAQPATVPVTISDDTGTILLSTTIPVAADGHTSFDLASTYASTAGIRGSIEFGVPSGGQISVLGLEFSPLDAFTSIPAIAIDGPSPPVTGEVSKTLH